MYKDGIYRVKLTDANPYCEYLVAKTYDGVQKSRKLPTLDDCKQQLLEWDEEYGRRKKKTRFVLKPTDVVEYVLKDKDGKILVRGNIGDITQFVGCSAKTIYNALADKNRKVTYHCDNEKKYLDVIRNVQTMANNIAINNRMCWQTREINGL